MTERQITLPTLPDTEWLLHMPARQYENEWTSHEQGYSSGDMESYARAAIESYIRSVGVVGSMPGTDGFTMACFRADDVPVGTEVYVVRA